MHRDLLDFPEDAICSISQQIMEDPVICEDGYSYERVHIEHWFAAGHRRSPQTNLPLQDTRLVPNIALRNIIDTLRVRLPAIQQHVMQTQEEALNSVLRVQADESSGTTVQLASRAWCSYVIATILLSLIAFGVISNPGTDWHTDSFQQFARSRQPSTWVPQTWRESLGFIQEARSWNLGLFSMGSDGNSLFLGAGWRWAELPPELPPVTPFAWQISCTMAVICPGVLWLLRWGHRSRSHRKHSR